MVYSLFTSEVRPSTQYTNKHPYAEFFLHGLTYCFVYFLGKIGRFQRVKQLLTQLQYVVILLFLFLYFLFFQFVKVIFFIVILFQMRFN